MKRILVIITTAFTATGGLASVMLNYYRSLDKKGVQIDFASTNTITPDLNDEIQKNGSKYYQLPQRKNIIRYWKAVKCLSRNYDVVHLHANSSTAVIELSAAKAAGVVKRIHHNHTSKTQHPVINALLHPFFMHSYTDAIACSQLAGDWLFGKNNYKILRNAINIAKFEYNNEARVLIRNEFGIKEEDFVVGHIGKFMDAKNHEFLIKVFAEYHLIPKT